MPQANSALLLNKQQTKFIQEVTGTFLYYARAVNSTIMMALSAITMEQAAPITTTMRSTQQFPDYVATNKEAAITYKVSNMVLAVHSDALYSNKPQARSRAGFFFSCQATQHFWPTMAQSTTQYSSSKQ